MNEIHDKAPVRDIEELTERLGGESALKEIWDETLRVSGIMENTIQYQWSPGDDLPPNVVAQFVENAGERRMDAGEARNALEMDVYNYLVDNNLFDELFAYDEDYIMDKFEKMLAQRGVEISRDDFSWNDFLLDVQDRGWLAEDPNIAQLLEQTRLRCNLTLATPEELNFDSVAHEVGHAVFGDEDFNLSWDDEELARDFWTNAVSWLVKQQGYELADLFDAERSSRSPFLSSLRDELENLTSGCPYLTVLVQANTLQLSDMMVRDGRNVEFPKDTVLGLFSHSDGSGAPLGIELERPLVVPKDLIFNISIEGADSNHQLVGYTVDETYGLVRDAWKSGVSTTDAATPSIDDIRKNISLPELRACVETALENARSVETFQSVEPER